MTRRFTWIPGGLMLLAGLVLVPAQPLSTAVQAGVLTRAEADRRYADLDRDDDPLVEGSRRLARIAELTAPSVVHIQSERRGISRGTVQETGSGVLMASDQVPGTYVVTNRHVVSSAELDDVSVHLSDGRVLRPDRVWTDPETDVAVLKLTASDVQPARWGDSDRLEIGSMVLAMGSPFGLSRSVTFGIISAKGRRSLKLGPGRTVINQDFLQTDAAINPGNSGGPLFDMRGRVVAINTAIASNSGGNSGIGFSIPSNLTRTVMEQLLANGKVQRSYLGVHLDAEFDLEAARRRGLDRVRGALVKEVYADTPGARAGLQTGDVVLRFEGIDVFDHDHLIHLVSLTPVGTRARLEILRDGRRMTVAAVVADRGELQQRSATPVRSSPSLPAYQTRPISLRVETITPGLAAQSGYEADTRGLLVIAVSGSATGSGPATETGASPSDDELQLYDVIEEVARQPVRSGEDLRRLLDERTGGEPVLLKVRRVVDGRPETRLILWRSPASAEASGETAAARAGPSC
ncbi:MAG TPA: trypsin-like peptidase domain-containing protein [Planctomycetaceae bacterium]|nr:trypsin-like peptidase domain-containing protein [Planctomycetaceae bacterium]